MIIFIRQNIIIRRAERINNLKNKNNDNNIKRIYGSSVTLINSVKPQINHRRIIIYSYRYNNNIRKYGWRENTANERSEEKKIHTLYEKTRNKVYRDETYFAVISFFFNYTRNTETRVEGVTLGKRY